MPSRTREWPTQLAPAIRGSTDRPGAIDINSGNVPGCGINLSGFDKIGDELTNGTLTLAEVAGQDKREPTTESTSSVYRPLFGLTCQKSRQGIETFLDRAEVGGE